MSGPWTPHLVQRIRAANMALIPTLTLFEVEAKKFGESPEATVIWPETAFECLTVFHPAIISMRGPSYAPSLLERADRVWP
jgi:hypothetical protein